MSKDIWECANCGDRVETALGEEPEDIDWLFCRQAGGHSHALYLTTSIDQPAPPTARDDEGGD